MRGKCDRVHHFGVEFLYEEIDIMPVIGDRPDLNLKAVVYATDFSLFSQSAGLYAARIASHFSATLLVTHAFTLSQAALRLRSTKSWSASRERT